MSIAVSAPGLAQIDAPDVLLLKNLAPEGLSDDPAGLATGANGGHQALNIAALSGATRILLLGYDFKDGPPGKNGRPLAHWFGDHPENHVRPYSEWLARMRGAAAILKARGIEVINCSPGSAIECFPKAELESVLPDPARAAVP